MSKAARNLSLQAKDIDFNRKLWQKMMKTAFEETSTVVSLYRYFE